MSILHHHHYQIGIHDKLHVQYTIFVHLMSVEMEIQSLMVTS